MSRLGSIKPLITIVGAGNLASSLAVALREAGYGIDEIVARTDSASLQKARRLARKVGATAMSVDRAGLRAKVVWFCVPDAAIASAAASLMGRDWKSKIALHSSGALASSELGILRRAGTRAASVHPMMTFVKGSRPQLKGVPFALEGDIAAVRVARRIVKDLGGMAHSIRAKDKAAYHAWGTFASPLLTALLIVCEHVAALTGVKQAEAKRRMLPILRQTLANYAALGAAGAFSGPIVRGDVDTVERHLRALRGVPVAKEVYVSLVRAALNYLPGKNKSGVEKKLDSLRSKEK